MGYAVTFLDNNAYGTEHINGVVSNLVGSGIAPFPTASTYNPTELNALTAALVASGVALDGCKCTIDTEDNTVTIGQGIFYFADGVTVVLDSTGKTMPYTSNALNYVYAEHDAIANTVEFYCTTTAPDEDMIVNFAQISTAGALTDTREIARSKIGTLGANVKRVVEIYSGTFAPYATIYETNFDISKFNVVATTWNTDIFHGNTGTRSEGLYNISTGYNIYALSMYKSNYSIFNYVWGTYTTQAFYDASSQAFYLSKQSNKIRIITNKQISFSVSNPLTITFY